MQLNENLEKEGVELNWDERRKEQMTLMKQRKEKEVKGKLKQKEKEKLFVLAILTVMQ